MSLSVDQPFLLAGLGLLLQLPLRVKTRMKETARVTQVMLSSPFYLRLKGEKTV